MPKKATYIFRWPNGPKSVKLSGSFNNWSTQIPMEKSISNNDFKLKVIFDLSELDTNDEENRIRFKFIVDDHWSINNYYKTCVERDSGIENNYINIDELQVDFDEFDKEIPVQTEIETETQTQTQEIKQPTDKDSNKDMDKLEGTTAVDNEESTEQPVQQSKKVKIRRKIRTNKLTGERIVMSEDIIDIDNSQTALPDGSSNGYQELIDEDEFFDANKVVTNDMLSVPDVASANDELRQIDTIQLKTGTTPTTAATDIPLDVNNVREQGIQPVRSKKISKDKAGYRKSLVEDDKKQKQDDFVKSESNDSDQPKSILSSLLKKTDSSSKSKSNEKKTKGKKDDGEKKNKPKDKDSSKGLSKSSSKENSPTKSGKEKSKRSSKDSSDQKFIAYNTTPPEKEKKKSKKDTSKNTSKSTSKNTIKSSSKSGSKNASPKGGSSNNEINNKYLNDDDCEHFRESIWIKIKKRLP
ncbi:hypothetical protein TBLA_0B00815 [Henningerozyma blattae CBS 6284]|uniref:AMP-activated protein kinase glycogen-binding domain-containing protein n=1 Tax=Henningerozyma blattae (strain ATCC 34711 / CBS 6284 / DSM 70876 / NBRC 10599 / NRRL Y-10934 / UCD 77-7) TaxID=1071380 RepID=I2GXS3_HENB6|nr:hypothetical protein TBLA_0B00815 [Tetrapisispora blattae CBS 6284]CCH58925.1 hypothetical protein TBLA_0B00815 [Tetrapisispora blattae CBS 6284]